MASGCRGTEARARSENDVGGQKKPPFCGWQYVERVHATLMFGSAERGQTPPRVVEYWLENIHATEVEKQFCPRVLRHA